MSTQYFDPTQWNISIMTVGPDAAREMLRTNSINRAISRGTVRKYALTMRADKWMLVPDPICFDTNGVFLNGQHRLHAVIESNTNQRFLVIRDVDRDAFAAMDRGRARSYSFALGIERKLAECARLLAQVLSGYSNIPDHYIENAADFLSDAHSRLSKTHKRGLSSAPVRLAAALHHIKSGDDYAIDQYDYMQRDQVTLMSPAVISMWKRLLRPGAISIGGRREQEAVLALGWRAFDLDRQDASRVALFGSLRLREELADFVGDIGINIAEQTKKDAA